MALKENYASELRRSMFHAPAHLTNSPELRLLLNRATYMCGVRVIRALLNSGLLQDGSPNNSPYFFAEP